MRKCRWKPDKLATWEYGSRKHWGYIAGWNSPQESSKDAFGEVFMVKLKALKHNTEFEPLQSKMAKHREGRKKAADRQSWFSVRKNWWPIDKVRNWGEWPSQNLACSLVVYLFWKQRDFSVTNGHIVRQPTVNFFLLFFEVNSFSENIINDFFASMFFDSTILDFFCITTRKNPIIIHCCYQALIQ